MGHFEGAPCVFDGMTMGFSDGSTVGAGNGSTRGTPGGAHGGRDGMTMGNSEGAPCGFDGVTMGVSEGAPAGGLTLVGVEPEESTDGMMVGGGRRIGEDGEWLISTIRHDTLT
jgi:hypothetical protein